MSSHATSAIFVIGGKGAQGIPVIRDLVADKKHSVRVLTRDPASPGPGPPRVDYVLKKSGYDSRFRTGHYDAAGCGIGTG